MPIMSLPFIVASLLIWFGLSVLVALAYIAFRYITRFDPK